MIYKTLLRGADLVKGVFNALGDHGWNDFSDGNNETIIVNNALYLNDSSEVVNDQTKARKLSMGYPVNFSINFAMKIIDLTPSAFMDKLEDDDIYNDGHTVTGNLADSQGANRTGASIAMIHPTNAHRVVFTIIKSNDYKFSKNLEIWKINASVINPAEAELTRVWTGKDIELNKQFILNVEVEEYNSIGNRSSSYVTIKVNNKMLLNREILGMNSTYGGLNSMVFQLKGTSEYPSIATFYKISDLTSISVKTWSYDVINEGVNEDNSADVLSRIATLTAHAGDLYVLMVGTNDVSNPSKLVNSTDYKTNLSSIVSALKAEGEVLILTPPRILDFDNSLFDPYIVKMNEVATEETCLILDINNEFLNLNQPSVLSSSFVLNEANTGVSGGVNLSYLGCEFVSNKICNFLKSNNLLSYLNIVFVGDNIISGVGTIGEGTDNGQTIPARFKAKYEYL